MAYTSRWAAKIVLRERTHPVCSVSKILGTLLSFGIIFKEGIILNYSVFPKGPYKVREHAPIVSSLWPIKLCLPASLLLNIWKGAMGRSQHREGRWCGLEQWIVSVSMLPAAEESKVLPDTTSLGCCPIVSILRDKGVLAVLFLITLCNFLRYKPMCFCRLTFKLIETISWSHMLYVPILCIYVLLSLSFLVVFPFES